MMPLSYPAIDHLSSFFSLSFQPHLTTNTDTPTQPKKLTTYFRGRKLHGTRLPVPAGYQGLLATPSTTILPSQSHRQSEDMPDEDDEEEPRQGQTTTLLQSHGTFTHVRIWGHERVPGEEDVFARGLGEWVRFAETVRFLLCLFLGKWGGC